MAVRHKHLKLDQDQIDRARRLLQVRTEREAVERALDLLLAEEKIVAALKRRKAVGGFVDVFGGS